MLLTGEVNAAVDGLLAGGATDVVVWDGHDSGQSLSALDIHPKARLLAGRPISPTLELDPTYSAVIFIGQHAMAGARNGILSHSYDSQGIQSIWVNGKPMPWRRSRPERCSGEARNQVVVIRQVAQCFWMEGLHAFSCISPSYVRNVLCAPHPSHLNTLVGMEATSLAREESKSARFVSFRQACVNQDLRQIWGMADWFRESVGRP